MRSDRLATFGCRDRSTSDRSFRVGIARVARIPGEEPVPPFSIAPFT